MLQYVLDHGVPESVWGIVAKIAGASGADCYTREDLTCLLMILVTISPTFETVSPIGNVSSSSVLLTCSGNVEGGMCLQEYCTGLWLSMSAWVLRKCRVS